MFLVLLAMSRPAVKLPERSGTIVMVADRSASMPQDGLDTQQEIADMLQSSMGGGDQFAIVAFGQQAVLEHAPQVGKFAGFAADIGKYQSNLNSALQKALAVIPQDHAGRILVLSDGGWTGGAPTAAALGAVARSIPMDFRFQRRERVGDVSIDRVLPPETVLPAETFMLTAWVYCPTRQTVAYELRCGGRKLVARRREMRAGLNRLLFRDRADEPGTREYVLSVSGEGKDPVPENNKARMLVWVTGDLGILCVSQQEGGAFARLLQQGGLTVTGKRPGESRWTIEQLSNYSAVIIENTPADSIGRSGMETLAAWIEQSGAGLMMTGGARSYGQGGFFQSPLDRIMPVSMEMKQEHRKFALAIVIAMDRSGSMAAPAGGGQRKMDLANIGAVQVLDLLSSEDEIGIIAVDSSAHTIVDLASVAENRGHRDDILRIESMGGGIFVYEALKAATSMLLKSKAGTRHIILFADAADSEQPGEYEKLLEKCLGANITCSVVGLGTENDCDAMLLRQIARIGDGQSFFTDSAREIPRLFAQDTFTVCRSSLVEEATPVKFTGGYTTIGGPPPDETVTLGGYNLCYVKPRANISLVTTDEYRAPVVASWYAGSGRVLCYTGEADGEYTGPIAKWPRVGGFFTSLARWTAGDAGELPGNVLLSQTLRNGTCRVELHLDPARGEEVLPLEPRLRILRGTPGATPEVQTRAMRWESADLLSADILLRGDETVLAAVAFPGEDPVALPPVCLPYSPEYRAPAENKGRIALTQLAASTGGQERSDIPAIWGELPIRTRYSEISHWLFLLAAAVFVFDVLQRRTGFLSSLRPLRGVENRESVGIGHEKPKPDVTRGMSRRTHPKPESEASKPITPPQAPPGSPSTLDAMKRARKRANGRTSRA